MSETKDTGICLLCVGQAAYKHFSLVFAFTLVIEITWKKKLPSNGFVCLWRS